MDTDAAAHIAAKEAADGAALPGHVQAAIDAFVVGCKNDGLWSSIVSVYLFSGAKAFAGALVPLKGPPRNAGNNNWLQDRKLGLRNTNVNTYIVLPILDTEIGTINSYHLAAYTTEPATPGGNRPITGSYTGSAQSAFIRSANPPNNQDFSIGNLGGGSNGNRTGITIGTSHGGTTRGYTDAGQVHSRATGGNLSGAPLAIFGAANGFLGTYDGRLAFASAGTGFTDSQALAYSARITAYVQAVQANNAAKLRRMIEANS